MKKKITVGVLFGGKSVEHEVSLLSAKNVVEALNKEKYNIVLIGIDQEGRWYLNDSAHFLLNAHDPLSIQQHQNHRNRILLNTQESGKIIRFSGEPVGEAIDVIFPVLHGAYGEDGTIQGLLKMANLPFVGSCVLGSAIGMDKDVMKRLLREAQIPVGRFLVFKSHERIDFDEIVKILGLPFFVKPARSGSSVGISKVRTEAEFKLAVATALNYDTKIIIEEFVPGREIECAILGNHDPMASIPGEVITHSKHEFYSYEAKYLDSEGALLQVPADLPDSMIRTIQRLSIASFKVLECSGMARVDFFVKQDGQIFVNEINTIPGFTMISMYPKLMKASGIAYPDLIDRLIELAFEKFKQEKQLKNSYTS